MTIDSIYSSRGSFSDQDLSGQMYGSSTDPLGSSYVPVTDFKGIASRFNFCGRSRSESFDFSSTGRDQSYSTADTTAVDSSKKRGQSKFAKYLTITALALGAIAAVGLIVAATLASHGVGLLALGFAGKFIASHVLASQITGAVLLATTLFAGIFLAKKAKAKEEDSSSSLTAVEFPGMSRVLIPKDQRDFDGRQGVLKEFQPGRKLQFTLVDEGRNKRTDSPPDVLDLLDVKPKDFGIGSLFSSKDMSKIGFLHLLGNNCSNITKEEYHAAVRAQLSRAAVRPQLLHPGSLSDDEESPVPQNPSTPQESDPIVTLSRDKVSGKVIALEIESTVTTPGFSSDGRNLGLSTSEKRKTRISFDYGFFGTRRIPHIVRVKMEPNET